MKELASSIVFGGNVFGNMMLTKIYTELRKIRKLLEGEGTDEQPPQEPEFASPKEQKEFIRKQILSQFSKKFPQHKENRYGKRINEKEKEMIKWLLDRNIPMDVIAEKLNRSSLFVTAERNRLKRMATPDTPSE